MDSDSEEEQALFHLMLRMLDYEPTQRIQLSDAVKHAFFLHVNSTSVATPTDQSASPKIDENCDVSRDQTTNELPVTS